MKRFLSVVFFTFTMFSVLTTLSYSETLVHVVFPKTTPIAVGERLNVDIHISDAQGVVGYELTVGFDPTVLRYIGGGNADYLPEGAFALSPKVLNNAVYIGATSIIGAASDSKGKLATLTFEVVAAKASTLHLREVILSDSTGMPLAVATRDGRIETVRSLPIGDVNGDGRVNILDLTLVASSFTVPSPATPRVDVNGDGTVDILDLVLIAQHLDVVSGDARETKVMGVRVSSAAFVTAVPPGGEISANGIITILFDNAPADVTVSAGTVAVTGKTATIAGPFTPGPLALTITWADGARALDYTIIAPDTDPPTVTGGTVKDGDRDVDPEAINIDGGIVITFSERVFGNIALQTEGGDDVGWLGRVEGNRAVLEIVRGREIGNETTYVIVGKVSDAAGNSTDVNITFVTKVKE